MRFAGGVSVRAAKKLACADVAAADFGCTLNMLGFAESDLNGRPFLL